MKALDYFLNLCFLSAVLTMAGCNNVQTKSDSEEFTLLVLNSSTVDLHDETVLVDLSNQPGAKVAATQSIAFMQDGQQLAGQIIDSNGDGNTDLLTIVLDLQAGSEAKIRAKAANEEIKQVKRTQAELSWKTGGQWQARKYIDGTFENIDFVRVPPEHTDHSLFFRYEGPGWESDKVGYRFYLDWRNAIDIFGKKTTEMVLQDVGQDGFESYHEPADWGMDILKVGASLGIGSIGMFVDGKAERVAETDSVSSRIMINGPLYSLIKTNYYGWQVNQSKLDLTSELSITAGSRLTKHVVTASVQPENLCTGIVKHDATEVLSGNEDDGDWTYFATYGKQSLVPDNLGMAVLYRRSQLVKLADDDESHVIVLLPDEGRLTYYFLAAWEQEKMGISSREQFQNYLGETVAKLNHPVSTTIAYDH